MKPKIIPEFFTFVDDDLRLICKYCKNEEIDKTKRGFYNDDEKITEDMLQFAGHHGQCDWCLLQCDDYPDCVYP